MSPDWWRDCRDGIEKCSSPTGDGNKKRINIRQERIKIEKCSSPTGDGNWILLKFVPVTICFTIEKCSSPTGDGNSSDQCLL